MNKRYCEINDFGTLLITNIGIKGELNLSEYKNIIVLDCSSNSIKSIVGLNKNLNFLICKNNSIQELNNLPPRLKNLYCANNKIKKFFNLPPGLIKLNCSLNPIVELDNLPIGLKELECDYTNVSNLNNLPSSLIHLHFIGCPRIKVDIMDLPNSLKYICGNFGPQFDKRSIDKNIWNIKQIKSCGCDYDSNLKLEFELNKKNSRPKHDYFSKPNTFSPTEYCKENDDIISDYYCCGSYNDAYNWDYF